MNNQPLQILPKFIWRSVVQAIILAVLVGILLSFVYGFVYHYQQKHRHIQQLAALLTSSASTIDGADTVAKQVSIVLSAEPNIQSILFYSTPQPIADIDRFTAYQSHDDWQNALFADTVSFNYPVVSDDITTDSAATIAATEQTDKPLSDNMIDPLDPEALTDDSTLVGYINITLDVDKLRANWLRSNLLLWLITTILAVIWMLYILRKLSWPVKDIAALTDVCEIVSKHPELEQLPVISQQFKFQELLQIKQTFTVLFDRLQKAQQDYEALAVFEQQLHHKDLSLNVQLHNFQSMITHELKTSLNAIVGGLQILDDERLSDEQKDALDIIRNGSEKLVLSLDQIIQLNQIQKGQISIHSSEFNPLQLIADLLVDFESIAKQKGLTLLSHVYHIDYTLEGDVEKIKQVLSILLSNAIKFTPVGQVSITSQLTHFDNSNRWQITIKDTGIGIDSDYIEDIFNPFFQVDSSQTRQYEGTGIGLPVVKQIAQLMSATIEVESTLGVGTQFMFTIPLPNKHQVHQKNLLAGLVVVYYYIHETGFLVDELQRLGAVVICHQQGHLVIDELNTRKVDMVMFAEDVPSSNAEVIAKRIRQFESYESEYRALLVYWYVPDQAQYLDSFEHGLKAAGIDYCHSAAYDDKALSDLLKSWLIWA
ncbi:sensor histidine kinase [Psychrobacter sp. ASPA161_6]|uniref:sensor histidine kinase n=1 Tax=Psychrobacter sp. ASPA161_6 TaxID=3160962 RepID=UPI003F8012B9